MERGWQLGFWWFPNNLFYLQKRSHLSLFALFKYEWSQYHLLFDRGHLSSQVPPALPEHMAEQAPEPEVPAVQIGLEHSQNNWCQNTGMNMNMNLMISLLLSF